MKSTIPISLPATSDGLSRWQAAGIHLLLSLLMALAVVAAMLLLWYPTPYFQAMGGGGLLALVVGVDVVLGPLITLIIFNTKKKSLKFDLACVALVQMIALGYGVATMFQARPIYTVFNKDRFDVIIAADVDAKEHAKVTNDLFKTFPLDGPKIAALVTPADANEIARILVSGIESRAFTQYYVPYADEAKRAGAASKTVAELSKAKPESASAVKEFLAAKNVDESRIGYLPIYTRNNDMTMIVERATGVIVGIVSVAPN